MKKVLSVFLCFVLLIPMTFYVQAVNGTNYYIDSENGSDSGNGKSPEMAWKSVENLENISLNPGDQVLFCRGGIYECNGLTFTCSGTKDNPIVIGAYGDNKLPIPHLFTEQKLEVLRLYDCDYITLSDLEITAHNGGGIWIDTLSKESVGITLTGLVMHDMQNVNQSRRDSNKSGAAIARACVMVKGLPARSRYAVQDLTIRDCEMYDVGNGILLWGSWNDEQKPWCDNEEDVDPVFNENTLVENVYFHDMTAEAIVVGICKNALVTNCRAIDCCLDEGTDEKGNPLFYNAPMWFWGSVYSTFDHCEIAGAKNVGDGMAVDFDSFSHYCTYQYIYSHDNVRFMNNNATYSGQHGNSVHHCLSVNDNKDRVRFSLKPGEHNFSFYNNTLIQCGDICLMNLYDSKVYNNIFVPMSGCSVQSDFNELIQNRHNDYRNNCYYNCPTPLVDLSSKNTIPGFIGSDYSDPNNFMLSSKSHLIGAGTNKYAHSDMDFFGNSMKSVNIGCYGGVGVSDKKVRTFEDPITKTIRLIYNCGQYIVHAISKLFEE